MNTKNLHKYKKGVRIFSQEEKRSAFDDSSLLGCCDAVSFERAARRALATASAGIFSSKSVTVSH
jgi:hypothetical protein